MSTARLPNWAGGAKIHLFPWRINPMGACGRARLSPATFPEGEVEVTVQQSLLFLVPTIPKTVTVSVVRGSQSYVKVDQVIDAIGVTEGASVTPID